MAFNSRLLHILAALVLTVVAVFAWDAALHGLWANLLLGLVVAAGLLIYLAVTHGARVGPNADPPEAGPEDAANLHILLDQMPIPLVRHGGGEGLRALNRAARSLFGTDDVIADGDGLVAAMTGAAPGASPVLPLFGRQYAVSVSEIQSDDGAWRLATLTDVQMEMHKAEAAALRDTLHILSHEIMNSLTPVASLADIAASYLAQEKGEQKGDNVQAAGEALEMLSRRAGSLTRFIEAYRSVARLPEPVLQPVDAGRLVQDIVAPFQATSGVVFEVDVAPGLSRVLLDEAQIGQAVINVVTNAVEATAGRAGRVVVTVDAAVQAVVIRISDNGEGVPEGLRANLFTAFATTKPKGTGTGLNLARQIALAHGGNLQLVEDGPAGMTTFAFTLPVRG